MKARAGRADGLVRQKAEELTRNIRAKDGVGEVHSLFEFVRDSIRYVRDPVDLERVADARHTLEVMQGDCDDKGVLLASLLMSIGHLARFVAVGFKPGDYSHVLVQTPLGRREGKLKWITLETTEPVRMGWFPPGIVSRMVEHV